MKIFLEKTKVCFIGIVSITAIIVIAVCFFSLHHGKIKTNTEISETVSDITESELSFSDIVNIDDVKLHLPEKIESNIKSVTTRKCKMYTENEIKTDICIVTIKIYNYGSYIEDDGFVIPKNAIKLNWNNTDVFITENSDCTTAIYYKDMIKYTITSNIDTKEIINIFT